MSKHLASQTKEERNLGMAALYIQGFSLQAISDLYGITREGVRKALKASGVQMRKPGQPRQPKARLA